jgi:RimJ/RimL family protein N-acetyltransferase
MSTRVLQTQRLTLRHFDLNDAAFIVELLNEPSWLQHIAMYARLGFGLYLVELTDSGEPLGMCGLIKRDTLQDVDLGFAFLSRVWGNGYAYEAATAVMSYAATRLRIDRIVAITSQTNQASGKLLRKLGFTFEHLVATTVGGQDLMLYSITSPSSDTSSQLL